MTTVLSARDIRAIRLANGIGQQDFADYLGIPKSTYSKWEYHENMYADVRARATNALIELGADLSLREPSQKFQRPVNSRKSVTPRQKYFQKGEPVETEQEPDVVNRPDHYHLGGIDVLEYAERKLSREQNIGFYRINVLKYVTRYDQKNGMEDLLKAKYYLDKLIKAEQQEE